MTQEKLDYGKPIPHREFPLNSVQYESDAKHDQLITLEQISSYAENRIIYEPVYFNLGFAGSVSQCKFREGTADRLLKALDVLPQGYGFKIFDAWRTFELQITLYKAYKDMILQNYTSRTDITEEETDALVNKYVSIPENDPENPPVHTTGGAVDLTIIDMDTCQELNMGTSFDFFGEKAASDYFERQDVFLKDRFCKDRCHKNVSCKERGRNLLDEKARSNRRMLYNVMTKAGFSNLPTEWWHYDYGNAYWAFSTGCKAIYKGIFK